MARHCNTPYTVRENESVSLSTKCRNVHTCGVSDVNVMSYKHPPLEEISSGGEHCDRDHP
jgi:hypothetical protein